MNPILEILERLGLEPTRQNILRIANRIPGYRRFADALISGTDTAVDVAAGASRAAVNFGGRAAGEMLDNPVRGYGNFLRGMGTGTLELSRFLPGEGRVEQALMRLAGNIAPDEGSAQGSLGRLVGDVLPDLVNADAVVAPGRMAEAEGLGMKALEASAFLPWVAGGLNSRLARLPGELDELNPRTLKQAFDAEAQRVADIPVPNAKAAENAQKAARLLKDGEVSFREVPATEFHQAITAAGDTPKGGQKLADFLTIYDEGEYGGMRTFLSEDGKTGYAIKPDGDLVSVFNTGVSGAGGAAVVDGIVNGATKLDAFDPYLPALYHNFGFKPDFTSPNFEFGENPVTFMSLADDAPRTLDEIVESIGSYGDYERPALSAPGGGSEWEKAAEAFGGEDLYTGRVQPDEFIEPRTAEDARLERIRAAGYDTSRPLYHGTAADFDDPTGELWVSPSTRTANAYAEDAVEFERPGVRYAPDDWNDGQITPFGSNIKPFFGRNLEQVGEHFYTGNPERDLFPMYGDVLTPGLQRLTSRYDLIPQGVDETRTRFGVRPRDVDRLPLIQGRRGPVWYDPDVADARYVEDMVDDVDLGRVETTLKPGWAREIPAQAQDGIIYRGISAEEMAEIQRTRQIQSRGDYNLSGQEGQTLFSTDPGAAQSYANSFAPAQHQAGVGRPAYVIGVKDPGTGIRTPGTAEHELGIPGALSADDIVEIYEGRPYRFDEGFAEIIDDAHGRREGSASRTAPEVGWRQLESLDEALQPGPPAPPPDLNAPTIGPSGRESPFTRRPVRGVQRPAPFPGIYDDPRVIASDAELRVAPESGAMSQLWGGVTRQDLADIALARRGDPSYQPSSFAASPQGSEAAEGVMMPRNTQRMVDILAEGQRYAPELTRGMTGWYIMDPAFQRLVQLVGPQDAPKYFREFTAGTGLFSPGSDVLKELARGSHALWLWRQGRLSDFMRYGGLPAEAGGGNFLAALRSRPIPSRFDMAALPGHPYHSTAQAPNFQRFTETGVVPPSPKVEPYIDASGIPGATRFQTTTPVGDAHWSRGVGLADVRPGGAYRGSVSNAELFTLTPWWRDKVARQVGYESVPAQANAWGLLGPRTGVETPLGAPKLELLSDLIMGTARQRGLDPGLLRDQVLLGQAPLGIMSPALQRILRP